MTLKETEINISGELIPISFNTFSKYQLMGAFGANSDVVFLQKLIVLVKENALELLMEIVKAGIKGDCLANKKQTPEIYHNINKIFAEMPIDETVFLWEQVFPIFSLHLGLEDKAKEGQEKKSEDESPIIAKQKPEPQTKIS